MKTLIALVLLTYLGVIAIQTSPNQPLTQQISLTGSKIELNTIDSSTGRQILGSDFTSSYYDEASNTMFLTTSDAIITVNMATYPSNTSTSINYIDPSFAQNMNDFYYDKANGQFIVVDSTISSIQLFRVNKTFIAISADDSPLDVATSGKFIDMVFIASNAFLIVAENGFAKYNIDATGRIVLHSVFTTPNLGISSCVFNYPYLYVGNQVGQLLRYNITDNIASSVNDANLTLPYNNSAITVLIVDATHNYIYAATAGVTSPISSIPSYVFRIPLTFDSVPTDYWQLSDGNENVIGSVIHSTKGLLFFLLNSNPGKIAQFSLPNWSYEGTVSFKTSEPGFFRFGAYVDSLESVFITGRNPFTDNPTLAMYKPPESCLSNCFGNGNCSYRYCTCVNYTTPLNNVLPYQQPWCQYRPCDLNCSGNALECSDGNCTCKPEFYGTFCDTRQCPYNCTSPRNGNCNAAKNYTCDCNPGFTGSACNLNSLLPCQLLKDCASCIKNPDCGWCDDSKSCQRGNEISALGLSGCRAWTYNECPNGLNIINIIVLCLLGIVMIVNWVSYFRSYTSNEDVEKRDEWYSLQRANKFWNALYQLQFLASASVITYSYPTLFAGFFNFYQFINFNYGLSFFGMRDALTVKVNTTNLLVDSNYTMAQFLGWSGIKFEYLLVSVVVLWIIIAFGLAIVGTLFMVILAAARGGDVGLTVSTRPLYILTRMFDLALFPFAMFSGVHLRFYSISGPSGPLAVVIMILVVIYLFGISGAFAFVKYGHKEKPLFTPVVKGRFLPIYGFLKIKMIYFVFIPIVRRVFMGALIGLLYGYPGAQIGIAAGFCFLHPVLTLLTDAYADPLQAWCEAIMSVLSGIAYLLLLGFRDTVLSFNLKPDPNTLIGFAAAYVSMHYLAIGVALLLYIVNSFQKFGVFTFSQLGACLCGGKGEDAK